MVTLAAMLVNLVVTILLAGALFHGLYYVGTPLITSLIITGVVSVLAGILARRSTRAVMR